MKRFWPFLLVLLFIVAGASALERRRKVPIMGTPSIVADAALVPHWYDGISVGNLDNSANWQEQSGLATPFNPSNSAYMWVLSDSPANMLAAVLASNASNQGVYTLASPPTYVDWEDVESTIVNGQPYLYVFDYGNNGNAADSRGTGIDMRIFRIKEPTITGSGGVISTSDYIAIDAAFPVTDGPTLRDCEASLVETSGKIWIITKRDATQRVYSLDHQETYTGTQTLVYEGTMTSLPASTTQPLGATNTYAVDAAISPDQTEILVKNYSNVYFFPRDPATQTVMDALQQSLVDVPAYVGGGFTSSAPKTSHPSQEPQGEGIAFSPDGRDWYSNSEYLASEGSTAARYPLYKYIRSPKVPTTVSFQDGVSPTAGYAGTSDTYIWDTNPTTNYGSDATIISDKAVGVETDQRKALLKFDLSAGSIPTNAVVVGARVDLYIAQEGQGWTMHQMLVNWDESSTYNSLTGGVTPDDVEAAIPEDVRNGVNLDTIQSVTSRNNVYRPSYYLFPTVQGWISGVLPNYGWIIIATDITGGDGQQHASSEAVTASQHPKLTLRYYVP